MLLGTTYSHRFAKSLHLDPIKSFNEIIALHFDVIRLGCYWDEIQTSQNSYTYSSIRGLLDICEKNNQKVVMTLGMKAPRWPEFYIPSCLKTNSPKEASSHVLNYLEKTVKELKNYSCIQYWQVENEPLNPVWPDQRCIRFDDLQQEVSLIRRLDSKRKIIINLWGNETSLTKTFAQAEKIADIVGLDIYYKQHVRHIFGLDLYNSPKLSDTSIKKLITDSPKPVWITELQAEPWEKHTEAYQADITKSMSPALFEDNFKKAVALNPEAILFWGSEYWLWKKAKGDTRYIDVAKTLLRKKTIR